jgi:putative MFS transporter
VLDLLEKQDKLTFNQWKVALAATLGDMLDFFDFYMIGLVLGFVVKDWHLTVGQSGAILFASGVSAPFGSLLYGWLADKVGRRTALVAAILNVSLATGAMALTPEGSWQFLFVCRFFVGFGVTGLYSVDITLMQEFSPAHKRGWFTGLTTTMLPVGSLLTGVLGGFAAPYIGWRWVVAIGLVPAFLCLYVRFFVPESPHWLLRRGRVDEARKSLAWALQMDPSRITLPATLPAVQHTRWLDIFKYPRSIVAGCLTGLTQTGGVGLSLWQIPLFMLVLNVDKFQASKLLIFVALGAVGGRFFCSWISDAWGRRGSGIFACLVAALLMFLAGYLHKESVAGVSVFLIMVVGQNFFGSGNYSIVGPYMGEMWPSHLRGSGMGFVYGVGNLGKFIGPLGLALIAGTSNYVEKDVIERAIIPGFTFFAYWYVMGALAFWLIGAETSGRTIDEIGSQMELERGRRTQIITAICGILGGAACVATHPFLPIAVFVGVGAAMLAPAVGGVIMLVVAIAGAVLIGVPMAGIGGLIAASASTGDAIRVIVVEFVKLAALLLTGVAGIAALMTAIQPETKAQPAQAAQ